MIPIVDLVILGLAVFRLSSLISEERGPYNIFGKIRAALGEYQDVYGIRRSTTEIGQGIMCLACCSVWWGVIVAVLYYLWAGVVWGCLPLALSALAMMVSNLDNSGGV